METINVVKTSNQSLGPLLTGFLATRGLRGQDTVDQVGRKLGTVNLAR